MRHVRDVMRMKSAGMATREIARRVGTAPSTVRLTIRRFEAARLTWPLSDDITDTELEVRLFASAGSRSDSRRVSDVPLGRWLRRSRSFGWWRLDRTPLQTLSALITSAALAPSPQP